MEGLAILNINASSLGDVGCNCDDDECGPRRGFYEYRVVWAGYPVYSSSWEQSSRHFPLENLAAPVVERELAKQNLLWQFRGSVLKERKLVELVTDMVYVIEVYEDYLKYIEEDDECAKLNEAELPLLDPGLSDRFMTAVFTVTPSFVLIESSIS
ncbi:hypothetical protein sr10070 [Sporisorium reilianum SRZ2]|uniref:Chromo domain-containing protein n=1 Tax=Sporisorium reilianum (strain SRZ2) TaxID=999809 RepID=E6ZS88_SPORE|nr:hypothetical protein sr10070 [Sporisorium reilianum SRZ2]